MEHILKTKHTTVTHETYIALAGHKTGSGFTLADAVRSGVENPDSSVGIYAGDAESYELFRDVYNPVIQSYHKFGPESVHKSDLGDDDFSLENLDPEGTRINSTRIRVGRNLAGLPFAPAITREQRQEVERRVVQALNELEGELAGQYFSLANMAEEDRVRLVEDHFLFKKGDRFLESAGANRDWPEARGIFHTPDKKFLVWVNEEDQLRIISMQQGGDMGGVFNRLRKAIKTLEAKLGFATHPRLGNLSSCPTNLGTAMRASVHVKLPKFSAQPEFKEFCETLGVSVRGIHGEHSESEGGVYDISNTQRLGLSEVDAVRLIHAGVKALLEKEASFE